MHVGLRAQLPLISNGAKEGEATRVGSLFQGNIVMVTVGTYVDKAVRVLQETSANVWEHGCVHQEEEDEIHIATLIFAFFTGLSWYNIIFVGQY